MRCLPSGVMVFMLLGVLSANGQSDPAAGVALPLAQERARRIGDIRYSLAFDIPEDARQPINGSVEVEFDLADTTQPVVLDFAAPPERIRTVTAAAGRAEPTAVKGFRATNEHLIIPAVNLSHGRNRVAIQFVAGDASLNRTAEFMYTLFVPARARLAFPCFDQPDLKARYALTLTVPAGWEALSNGAEQRREAIGHTGTRISFAETAPLPTYLFAFAAGKFQVETAERGGRTFRMFHRETDAAKVARNRDAIFDLHAAALSWLEHYTGIPYAFGKFDFLLVPSFQFGGMEHAGAIFYNASGLLLDPSATQNQKLGRASVIAHETAHMWFGDLVTMRWFDDVWMKEVFANFMAAKIVNPSFPEINHELRFLYAHYPAAYEVDRTAGTNAVRQRLDNLAEAGSLYGAIIYQKAPIVMRQLEMTLGEQPFRDGLREYLAAHKFGNATWPDLIRILDARTADDLAAWSRAWVDEAGRPEIATRLTVQDGTIASLAFEQHDPIKSRALTWSERLRVTLGYGDSSQDLPVALTGRRTEVAAARGLPAPLFVLPTGGGVGYGGFVLDASTRAYLLGHLAAIKDPLTRGSALVTLWEDMLDRRSEPAAVFDTLLSALPGERDELNVQRMLGYLEQAYWKFLPVGERDASTPRIESLLRAGLDAAPSPSVKSAWFSALRDTARSRATLEWLERVWRQTETVPGLVLAEPDYVALAQALALREVPNWKDILDRQEEQTKNPDRKAQFAFVRPALAPDVATRDAFFERLGHVENRRREPWVLQALSSLHHPLRAASAEKYIPRSLEMLRDIQRTGDIFFPKRWMDATLSGHRSESVARMVRTFVNALPADYPDRLRRIILSAADDLFRITGQ